MNKTQKRRKTLWNAIYFISNIIRNSPCKNTNHMPIVENRLSLDAALVNEP